MDFTGEFIVKEAAKILNKSVTDTIEASEDPPWLT